MRVVTTCTTRYHLINSPLFPRSAGFLWFSGQYFTIHRQLLFITETVFRAVRTEFLQIGWRCLRRRPASARLLGLRVRIPSEALISVSCECCVLLVRGPYVEFVIPPGALPGVVCLSVIVKLR